MGAMQRLWTFLGFTEDESEGAPQDAAEPVRRKAPVFNLHTHRPMEIVVLEPRSFDEARAGADHLKARRPVIVNLRDVDRDLARRVVDFTCGVTYAVDGHMQRVGDEIFLFTPNTVTVMAESSREGDRELFPMA
ncbi:MAG: cell division protein SepF [Armatimonadota bacterium]|nr:cell division protein SepF [Armatimonadota bacterium]